MLRVLCLTRYAPQGASSRVRVFQYLEYLRERGVAVEVYPLLDEEYIAALYRGRGRSWWRTARAYTQRIRLLIFAQNYDLVWYEKEVLPWLPFLLERMLLSGRAQRVVDYDDAIYQRYLGSRNAIVRWVLGKKIASVMKHAHSVVAGSHAILAYAEHAGASRLHFLPSVIDLDMYPVRSLSAGRPFTIGWIGTPITAREYLPLLLPVLHKLAATLDFRLVLIGAGEIHAEGIEIESREWALNKEAELLADVDVGIMPLTDGPWERGKCGYKLIQYMACGIPVVASAVGENNYIVREGENGFLARSEEDWLRVFTFLSEDPERARAMGLAGRRLVEQEYSLQVTAPRLLSILREAASRAGER